MSKPAIAIDQDELVEDTIDLMMHKWNIESLRPMQREAMTAVMYARDLLMVCQTGHGKSLCYQLPGFYFDGTVVISPLISLMKDQVDKLNHRGMASAFLNSTQDHREQAEIMERWKKKELHVLYVSPERFLQPAMIAMLKGSRVDHIVVDEAHCIVQWGHDFRPSYHGLTAIRDLFPEAIISAYTATATESVRDEIIKLLKLSDPTVLIGEFDRPNLNLSVVPRTHIDRQLIDYIRSASRRFGDDASDGASESTRSVAGIIYCITRADTVQIAAVLRCANINATCYHAGMDDDMRASVQDRFMQGELEVVVATVAFGMGLDHPHVRFVVHAAMPSSIETYHQEIGRAGRDGEPAECVMFYHPEDWTTWCKVFGIKVETQDGLPRVRLENESERAKNVLLRSMVDYCEINYCRHWYLSDYFDNEPASDSYCQTCDNCKEASGVRSLQETG